MKISILCTDPGHPVVPYLVDWIEKMATDGHQGSIHHELSDLPGGDVLFLVSCSQIVRQDSRKKYKAVLVLHASDLPNGRGWSPHIWAILGGASRISVCALEAADPVDTGAIWLRTHFDLEGHELLPQINSKLFKAELWLMTEVANRFKEIVPTPQSGTAGPYCTRRTPAHSRLDAEKSIADQFDLLRVVDNERYPAYFEHRGCRYLIRIEKDVRGDE